jgi:dipeptidyl aminopeptidase/acylaminoacyl peptidase
MLYDISVVQLIATTPPVDVATRVPIAFGRFTWSPDSNSIAYMTQTSSAGLNPDDTSHTDMYRINVNTGMRNLITAGAHSQFTSYYGAVNGVVPYWSPSGDELFFCANGKLWSVPAVGGSPRLAAEGLGDHDFKLVVSDYTTNQVFLQGKSQYLLVVSRNRTTKRDGFGRVDIRTGQWWRLREEDMRYGGFAQEPIASAENDIVAYVAEDGRHPADFWVMHPTSSHAHQVSHLNPQFENGSLRLGSSRLIDYRLPDGSTAQGAMLLPAQYEPGKRYPFLVRLYPGNVFKQANLINEFGLSDSGTEALENMQLFASQGYGVLIPEIPQKVGSPMRDIADAIDAATDKLVEIGLADPTRLGIFGHSYGGYATLAVIVQSTRFRAAVNGAGVSDIMSFFGYIAAGGTLRGANWVGSQGLVGGTPWQFPTRYVANSPVWYLDRVQTPLLVWHGEDDRNVPISQSDEVFAGLKRLEKVVEYRRYAAEGHVIRDLSHQTDLAHAEISWFDRWLKKPIDVN